MKVLVTGAFGNVGTGTLQELLRRNHEVRIFEKDTQRNRIIAGRYKRKAEVRFGDILNIRDLDEAVRGMDVIVHLAAVIPPLADRNPELARYVNVGGTENVIRAMRQTAAGSKLIYTSSIAVYGDRVDSPNIGAEDEPRPNKDDHYANQKLRCEELIRSSGIENAVLRLTYVVSPAHLKMDPLMFEMPPDTSIEICHFSDVGLAIANAVDSDEVWGKMLHIAGGPSCRTTYREYVDRMLEIFGMGKRFIPEGAFSRAKFHCGFMDTEESERLLHYQRCTLDGYYREIKKRYRLKSGLISFSRPFARWFLLNRSPYYSLTLRSLIQAHGSPIFSYRG
ncbi:MAG: NAD(P)-dependent oxidoreductase [Spirochaetes bacterium]|nr:NAD(P)-dependent oxidoreductase [Spirochaetota bacterium]